MIGMSARARPRLRFDRHEFAGALGDLGTDVPLLVALVATARLDAASVCITFGLAQIASGLRYGIPMPVQPLKAMAVILLASHLGPGVVAGGGLVIGATMLLLALTGALEWLARVVPLAVIRGLQVGLAVTLGIVAVRDLVWKAGATGVGVALVGVVLVLVLRAKAKRVPAAVVLVAIGVGIALASGFDAGVFGRALGFSLPHLVLPTRAQLVDGALLLALPQIPLSLGNSVLATSRATADLFPDNAVSVRKIGVTYGLLNVAISPLSGMPVCHGCGGLVGFHAFGARTGGAPVIYGAMWLATGLFLAAGFDEVAHLLPTPILGVLLAFEALALASLAKDVLRDRFASIIAALVALAVVFVPFGHAVGLLGGTILSWGHTRLRTARSVP